MELVRDTPLEHGVLFWPLAPPTTSMVIAVKVTFELPASGPASLAEVQDPVCGNLFWDDDPAASVRYPNDLALLKPRGEYFVTGSVRPLSGREEERTLASIEIGGLKKKLAVYGDRKWTAGGPSRPMPFTEMPLAWERAFGGPGHAANPLGRGIAPDERGEVWLPNFEIDAQPITDKSQRPNPAALAPLAMTWDARRAHLGTYDERWRRSRWPWFPEDFRVSFFNEALPDQQIEGYWRGDEAITLLHLHPTHPRVSSRLPRILPRAFVERDGSSRAPGAFEEIGLVLDTLTIDADRGLALCVYRGRVDLEHDQLQPDGLARLFLMHEDLSAEGARAGSSSDCRARMEARLAADRATTADLSGVEPPASSSADQTMQDDGAAAVALARAGAEQAAAQAKGRADAEAALAKVKLDLKNTGADADVSPAELPTFDGEAADIGKLRAAYEAIGEEIPEELTQMLDALPRVDPAPEDAPTQATPDLRALVVECHRLRRPLSGDFTGAQLDGLALDGLDARDAILSEASFRGSSLEGAKLDGASLHRADFLGASLAKASLLAADLTDAVLEQSNLRSARLDRATFERAEMQEANLEGASLVGADLTGADLSGADLTGAACAGAFFSQATLVGCRFARADLTDARMYGVKAAEVVLDQSNLTNVRVGRGADLSRASVRGAKARGSNWRDATLEAANFAGSDLANADFTGANLRNANLAGCPLRRASFQLSVLEGASLRDADVYAGSFQMANLDRADLRGANLYSANFFRARGEGTSLDGANVDGTMWERR